MCQGDTGVPAFKLLLGSALVCGLALGQTAPPSQRLDWRKVGSSSVDLMLAAPATGPVDSVWFAPDGRTLFARTRSGKAFETVDFENWTLSTNPPPRSDNSATVGVERLPASGAVLRGDARHLYALDAHLYVSEDGGRSWTNLTAYRNESVIGPNQRDLAVSPADPNDVVVANERGVWRSLDGGLSWTGLNQFLPNLMVRSILEPPADGRGMEIEVDGVGALELQPSSGAQSVWRPVRNAALERQAQLQRTYSMAIGTEITASAAAGDVVYTGAADGRIWISVDRARTWTLSRSLTGGPVTSLFVDPQAPRVALATLGGSGAHVLRTTNSGGFWDDLSSNLPDAPAHAVAAERISSAVYVATDRGVYFAHEDLEAPAQPTNWTLLGGNLPAARATAVELGAAGYQLYVGLEGYGIYAAAAPHRRSLKLVNAADFSARAAAPGSLVSVLGGAVKSARAGDLSFPVLASSQTGAQIQVPFEVTGSSVSLALEAELGRVTLGLPVQPTSPAIFVDRDGAPMLLDADNGLMLDAGNTARSNARIQVLSTGLGRVKPDWATGIPAPLENPPAVVATVRAYLDGAPVAVTRATLAPGYVGFYLIELQVPAVVNSGPADLYLTAEGHESNHVRLYLEP